MIARAIRAIKPRAYKNSPRSGARPLEATARDLAHIRPDLAEVAERSAGDRLRPVE